MEKPICVYLAGPMRGIPEFNFPAFMAAAKVLRAQGLVVFNPAERDIERHGGVNISLNNLTGDERIAAKQHGFDIRIALADDLRYICHEADAIVLLPGWATSRGATAEFATAYALGLHVIEFDVLIQLLEKSHVTE